MTFPLTILYCISMFCCVQMSFISLCLICVWRLLSGSKWPSFVYSVLFYCYSNLLWSSVVLSNDLNTYVQKVSLWCLTEVIEESPVFVYYWHSWLNVQCVSLLEPFMFLSVFVSISQVIGCDDRLRNDLYCVEWGVKLYSNLQPTNVSISWQQ